MMEITRTLKPQVYSYSRFSDIEQAKGSSLSRQSDYAKNAAIKFGLELNEELMMKDLGKSAFHAEHKKSGAYGAFLDAIKQGLVAPGSYLIVENFDRLSRQQAWVAQNDIAMLIDSGINIITAADDQLYNQDTLNKSPHLLFMMTAIMIRAHEESLIKQKRSIKSVADKIRDFREGNMVDVGGPCPFWMKRLPKGSRSKFEFSEKVEAARIITHNYLEGKSHGQIQDILKEKGISSPKGDELWGSTTISNVLENEALFGRKTVRLTASADRRVDEQEHVLDGYYPHLISKSQFDLIQQIKKTKKKGRTGYRFNSAKEDKVDSVVYLLSGYGVDKSNKARSVCSKCHSALGSRFQDQFNRKGKYTKSVMRLDCTARKNKKGCDAKGIAQRELERSFLQAVHEHVDFSLLNKIDSNARAVEIIDSKLDDIDGVVKRATELFLLTDDPESHKLAKKTLEDAKAEKAELLKQREDGKEFIISSKAIQEFKDNMTRAYDNDDDFEARSYVKNILLQCVDKLVVNTEPRTLKSLGLQNLYRDAKVWTVQVDFRSGKRITVYHDTQKDMSLFNMIEGGENSQHAFTPEAVEIWDKYGDEAFVAHLTKTGLGVSNYVEDYLREID